MRVALSLFALLVPEILGAQNLIINPSAESAVISPWVVQAAAGTPTCNGALNWGADATTLGITSRSGSYVFFPGCNGTTGSVYQLRQSIDISGYAVTVDAGNGQFTFSGWYSDWNQTNPDECAFQFDFYNASSTLISGTSTGWLTAATNNTNTQSAWVRAVNTFTVPVGTRSIILRLLSRHNTGTAIDSYFDNLALTVGASALPVTMTALRATAHQGSVLLNWESLQAATSGSYSVQWSRDGHN